MPYEQIRVEKQNSVCIITLNRPEKLNAWTPDMSRELGEAITAANEDDEIGAIVMTGEGRGFCAGADMSYFQNNIDASENKAHKRDGGIDHKKPADTAPAVPVPAEVQDSSRRGGARSAPIGMAFSRTTYAAFSDVSGHPCPREGRNAGRSGCRS